MPTKPKPARPDPNMPDAESLMPIVTKAIREFKGQGPELESAIGMLFVGHAYGWKVIHLIHSTATVRKYEKILDIKVKEEFQAETSYSDRSYGYSIAKKLSNFWKAVKGEAPDKNVRSREFSNQNY